VPKYASGACDADFARYSKACACAGVKVVTSTAEASVKTVTIEAGTGTSIDSIYSSTETSTDLETATTSTTLTTVISVTDTVMSTTTETASSTTVISETVTPTSVVTLTYKPPGSLFHARVAQSNDGTTRYMNNVAGVIPAWQTGLSPGSSSVTQTNPQTDEFTLSVAGRRNIMNCGNILSMAGGGGSNTGFPADYCVRLFPIPFLGRSTLKRDRHRSHCCSRI
jgi:hypothetical protein